MTTKTMTPAAGLAMPGVEATRLSSPAHACSGIAAVAVGGWRQVQAPISGSALPTGVAMPIRNRADQTFGNHAAPANTTLHTVTTNVAGRGNTGFPPWRFPV